ncbi:polysaccharide deacetylase family protein [Bacillus sp. BRMEA1]|uniref:polysaccharide deacetylase family protein n=1 Tax=Neobacillus endophyticus TaxID=2738405 RepID=UPI001565B239|nr:polysaccharide deacetylase family protein [Neobacillus endophyticus]NRD79236.1 polysaccharide deacetylase family protein [Neobacillus endophyticus]
MTKLINYAMISFLFFSFSSFKTERAQKQSHPLSVEAIRQMIVSDSSLDFQPKATIITGPIRLNSTAAYIRTIDRKIDVSGIEYHLWRTADGQEGKQTFLAGNKEMNFPHLFNIKDFSGKRGEYQIEAYGLFADGRKKLLAKSTLVFQQKVPILMYHSISFYRGKGIRELFVSPVNFERQMLYLKNNGYTLLTFERWDDINKVNKPIFVTFDDGIKDNLNALYILEKLKDGNFKPTATEFAIAGFIDSDSYRLTTADLKEMVNSGIFSIQSHTMTHADLPNITNYDRELRAAKQKIEQITGEPVIAISYPYGGVNNKVVEETRKQYKFAATTKPGKYIQRGLPDELFLIRRVRINYTTNINHFAELVACE